MDTVPTTISCLPIAYCLLATLIITLIAVYYYIEMNPAVRLAKKLPSPPRIPILGHTLISLKVHPRDIVSKAIKYHDEYGSVISASLGTKVIIFLSDPQDFEVILSSHVHIDKSVEYQFFKPWLGDGLLITTGDKWRRHRKIIAPTFHMSILKTFIPLFYENSIDLVKRLRDKIGIQFDCHDYLSTVTVDILTETAMGVKRGKTQKTGYDYAMAVMKMSDIIHRRHYDLSLRLDMLFKYSTFAKMQEKLLKSIHATIDRVIKEKLQDMRERCENDQPQKITQNGKPIENRNKDAEDARNNNYTNMHYVRDDLDDIDESDVGEKKRLAFLEMMIDLKRNNEQMTDEEIKDEVNTIMFEGHDTTAAGSSFALCILGCHQNIQARVYEELDAIFGDSDRQCTFKDTIEMKYLERVILETLRLFPPVPVIARHLKEDVKIITGNYVLPKTATVIIAPFTAHRSKKYYSNPEVFNPDNFLPEKMQQRHYYAYIPFSAGPRSCVGRKYAMLKLKVLLSTILRHYRVISDVEVKDFPLQGDIILKRSDGFNIKIEPRKSVSQNTTKKTRI